ncbi:M48 family metallopeptidase [Nostoc sp. C052]|nr:M48 family metallopeptidase [Nostoc sp. C052]
MSVLEYVLAHEIVHLLHRNHGNTFWEALSRVMSRL